MTEPPTHLFQLERTWAPKPGDTDPCSHPETTGIFSTEDKARAYACALSPLGEPCWYGEATLIGFSYANDKYGCWTISVTTLDNP